MIQVLARAAALLRALEGHPEGRSLAELAAEVGLPRSTVHRIMATLQHDHLVAAVSAEGRYRLGPGLMRLASSSSRWFAGRVHEHLRQLSRTVGETVDLSVRSGDQVLFIDQIMVAHRLQAVSAIGLSFPLHCTAPGKALLAELPCDEVNELLAHGLERFTEHTILTPEALHAELVVVRESQVAFDHEEHHLGIGAVGTALRNPYGIPAAISIPVPISRFSGREAELAAAVLAARDHVEAALTT